MRSIKWVRSGKSSKYSSSSTLYILDISYCFVIYISYFLYTYFIFFRSAKSSKYSSSPSFVSVHIYIYFSQMHYSDQLFKMDFLACYSRPARIAELPRSKFDPELFPHSAYVEIFVTFATKVPYLTFCNKM